MKKIPFVKMHGTGNDFVLVEQNALDGVDPADFAREVSRRHFGAGSDGLLVVADSLNADARMLMFNPDGSQAMCGNGIRCFGKYVFEKGIVPAESIRVETVAGIKGLTLDVSDGMAVSITADMGEPVFDRSEIPVAETLGPVPLLDHEISVNGKTFSAGIVSMGNPHCVIFAENMNREDVIRYGSLIEHNGFFPERVNAEFVEVRARDHISVQVFERGAGYTLSCGTGTCAAAVIARLKGLTDSCVRVTLPGGELIVEYDQGGHVYMSGPAVIVYEGLYYF